MSQPKMILFVCLGNIVRSPLAEGMFRHQAQERGLGDRFEVDSAGTSSYHIGERPDSRMRRTAAERGLDYDGRARQVRADDLEEFDLIIAMDRQNLHSLRQLADSRSTDSEIRLLREFDPQAGEDMDVPDPYYGGQSGFEQTYGIISRSVAGLLDALAQDGA